MNKRKIGIFGGTFNPIHNGHIEIAMSAYNEFGLDKVVFMPAGHPPHKDDPGCDMTHHRLSMVYEAVKGIDYFEVSTFEIEKGGKSYTCETLTALNALHPDFEYYFIIGGDSLSDFESWYHPEIIAKCATILATVRPYSKDGKEVVQSINEARKTAKELSEKYEGNFEIIDMKPVNVSSSMIRDMVAAGEDISRLVPKAVYKYINEHCLYENKRD